MGMSESPKPNGFADHYPVFKWLFHWEYTLFSDKPKCSMCCLNGNGNSIFPRGRPTFFGGGSIVLAQS